MQRNDYLATLEIDGRSVPASVATFHYQDDPFPAGHWYRLRVQGPRLERLFYLVAKGEIERPDRTLSEHVLSSVDIVLSRIWARGKDKPQFRYFLNTVERVTFTDEELMVEGVCSEILTRPNS